MGCVLPLQLTGLEWKRPPRSLPAAVLKTWGPVAYTFRTLVLGSPGAALFDRLATLSTAV
jgi:hypothetical protein